MNILLRKYFPQYSNVHVGKEIKDGIYPLVCSTKFEKEHESKNFYILKDVDGFCLRKRTSYIDKVFESVRAVERDDGWGY